MFKKHVDIIKKKGITEKGVENTLSEDFTVNLKEPLFRFTKQ